MINKQVLVVILILLAILGVLLIPQQQQQESKSEIDTIMGYNATPTLIDNPQGDAFISPSTPVSKNALTSPIPTNTPKPTSTPAPTQAQATAETAIIKTSKGNIELTLFPDVAPKTVANFVSKAKSGYYKNLTFHRVEDWVIQGGDPAGNGTGGGNMGVEFNSKPFGVGALGVASRGDGKVQNDSQFFITKSDASWLNRQYTNFGQVSGGMDVVNKIAIGDKILEITVE